MPEKAYGGSYVRDLAQMIIDEDGDTWLSVDETKRLQAFRERGYKAMLDNVKETLALFGTTFDTWFSEHSLFVPGEDGLNKVQHAFNAMKER